MITTFREAQALLILYRACPDVVIRRKAVELVPEIADIADTLTYNGPRARRRKLLASASNGHKLGCRYVVCRDEDLEEYKRDYALSWDLAGGVVVVAEDA